MTKHCQLTRYGAGQQSSVTAGLKPSTGRRSPVARPRFVRAANTVHRVQVLVEPRGPVEHALTNVTLGAAPVHLQVAAIRAGVLVHGVAF